MFQIKVKTTPQEYHSLDKYHLHIIECKYVFSVKTKLTTFLLNFFKRNDLHKLFSHKNYSDISKKNLEVIKKFYIYPSV